MGLGLDEDKAREAEQARAVEANYRTLSIIWLAILASVIGIFVITRVLGPMPSVLTFIFWILFAIGIANFGASFLLKRLLVNQAVTKRKPELVRGAYLIAFALCESIGLLGLVAHLITGVEQYYFFFVLSGFGILIHKPQRDDILSASSATGT